MKFTYSEVITRIKTIDLPEKYSDMDPDDINQECDEVRELTWDAINESGWDTEYCHTTDWEVGEHEPVIYLKS